MRLCSVTGCTKQHYVHDLCVMHYRRWQSKGTVGDALPLRKRRPFLRQCCVTGCDRKHKARGLCEMHYERMVDSGRIGTADRLLAEKGSGTIRQNGYIAIGIDGRDWYAHRYVWEQAHGPIPPGHHIHHINGIKTDNRLENLQCLSASEHIKLHNSKGEN